MRLRDYYPSFDRAQGKLIATFGEAQLIRTLDCKYELRGGSRADRTAAKEWISLFMHTIVIREVPIPAPILPGWSAGNRTKLPR